MINSKATDIRDQINKDIQAHNKITNIKFCNTASSFENKGCIADSSGTYYVQNPFSPNTLPLPIPACLFMFYVWEYLCQILEVWLLKIWKSTCQELTRVCKLS
jgi:hypothetical protein